MHIIIANRTRLTINNVGVINLMKKNIMASTSNSAAIPIAILPAVLTKPIRY